MKLIFVMTNRLFQIFWRFSLCDQSSDKFLEPYWSDSVLVRMLFFARFILTCGTKERILLAIPMKTDQTTLFFINTLRVPKTPLLHSGIVVHCVFFLSFWRVVLSLWWRLGILICHFWNQFDNFIFIFIL